MKKIKLGNKVKPVIRKVFPNLMNRNKRMK
jgi:hypothetical protein